jgi:hypothetical protein
MPKFSGSPIASVRIWLRHGRPERYNRTRSTTNLACLYGLYTLLRLHFVQEENYFILLEDDTESARRGQPDSTAETTKP